MIKILNFYSNSYNRVVVYVFYSLYAVAAMLLGLHAFQELPGVYRERVHVAIYMMSGVVGVFIMVLASYNLYAIMFKKCELYKKI